MSKQKTKDWEAVKAACEAEEAEAASEEKVLEYPSHEALESQLLSAEKKAEENLDKAMRAIAELDNVRRRAEREVANAHRYGVEKLIKELLPVIDSFEQALLAVNQETHKEMAQGLELTMKLLLTALEKFEVTQLDPSGESFNPQEHEAMSIQISDEVSPNTVLTVFQKGYKLADRVIRPARVIVSKPSA